MAGWGMVNSGGRGALMMDWLYEFFESQSGKVLLGVLGVVGGIAVIWSFLHWAGRRTRVIKVEPQPVRIVQEPTPPPPPEPPLPVINPQSGRPVLGRDKDVETLRALLTGPAKGVEIVNSGAVLAGHGGFGKSTLARHYAATHRADYHGVLWADAESRQSAISGLCAACETLGLETPEQPQESQAKAVVAAIARQVAEGKPWLLIFDNVETRADVEGLLPAGAHILVTTRQGQGWAGWAPFEIETLPFKTPEDPAPRLLMQAEEPEAARALAEALGGLPLALVLMGGFLKAEGMGFAEGEAHLKEAMARAPVNEGYPTSLLGAVRLSYEKLSDDSKIVAQLCSFWAPEGLGPKLIANAPGGPWWNEDWVTDLMPEPIQSLAQDPFRIRDAFTELSARSLLTGTGDSRAMHRMTALALRVIGENALAPASVALLAAVYPGGGGEHSAQNSKNYPLCARLTPHVRALLAGGATPDVAAWNYLLNQVGGYLDAIADYQGRLPMAEESLRIMEARLKEADRDLAVAHANLGAAYQRLHQWEAAEAALRRAVALHEAHRPDSADLADSLDMLGGLLVAHARAGAKGRLPKAAKLHQRALALRRRLFGRRTAPVALALNNLGAVRSDQGRRRAAARLYGAAHSIWRAVLPEGDARLATGAMNSGASWLRVGDAAEAEPLLREALAIREAAFAEQPQHPERRNAAGWLIACLLVRARAGVNRGAREAEAKRLSAEYGFDFAEMERLSRQFPDLPLEA